MPKQFLHFGDGESLLQKTAKRFLQAPFVKQVLISTSVQHLPLVQKQLEKVGASRKADILLEPCRRNTAPAIALAVKRLGGDDPILVLPSDHLIEPESVFLNAIEEAMVAVQEGKILLFGIQPTKPETGYGYIEVGSKFNAHAFHVKRFVEKPSHAKAVEYLSSRTFYWNAGIFGFTPNTFWNELKMHAPDIFLLSQLPDRFTDMPNLSIDYALIEKSSNILVAPLPITWSDVGSWDSVYDVLSKDEHQNVQRGNVIAIDTKNSLILGGRRLLSTIGLDDMLIVETEEATFIGRKGESQKVKALVEELLKRGKKDRELLYQDKEVAVELVTLAPGAALEAKTGKVWFVLGGEVMASQTKYQKGQWIRGSETLTNQGPHPAKLLIIQQDLES
jgi:mannose-1-phosphate guanylyltransferase/mannose-6-phosphate isomerase